MYQRVPKKQTSVQKDLNYYGLWELFEYQCLSFFNFLMLHQLQASQEEFNII
jgi:hypothetical protein